MKGRRDFSFVALDSKRLGAEMSWCCAERETRLVKNIKKRIFKTSPSFDGKNYVSGQVRESPFL